MIWGRLVFFTYSANFAIFLILCSCPMPFAFYAPNPQHATHNLQLAARSPQLEIRNPKPVLFFINAAKFFGRSLLFFDIDQPGNHNALCLGRAGAMHGFGKVPDGGRSQGHVFDQS